MASPDDTGTLPRRSLLILIWTCFSVAFVFVAVRTVIRVRSPGGRRVTPAEDYCILFALAALLALCVLETIQLPSLYYITGVLAFTVADFSAETIIAQTKTYLRYQFPIVILFWTVLWAVKAAFLALYWRLFRDLEFYRRAWYVLAVFILLAYGGCVTTLALSCGPDVRNFFGFATCAKPEYVWSSNFSVYFSTASDVATDLLIMAMPLRLIYNIKVSLKQKVGLVCVFSLGCVMIVFAIIRAKQVLVEQAFVNLTLLMVWSTLAASISVIVGTLPALKVLITTRSRASASRSAGNGDSAGTCHSATRRKNSSFSTHPKSVALGSLRRASNKSVGGSNSDANESQEKILAQRDVSISYSQVSRPPPVRYNQI